MSVDTELGREISQIINIILQEVIQMQRERQYNDCLLYTSTVKPDMCLAFFIMKEAFILVRRNEGELY